MNITGLGIDIEDIGRFADKPFKTNESFYRKIFTPQEIEYSTRRENPYQSFTVRFCAKEAFIKAIGYKNISYLEIEVLKENEKPFVVWQGSRYTVSLSHDRDKAIAIVII